MNVQCHYHEHDLGLAVATEYGSTSNSPPALQLEDYKMKRAVVDETVLFCQLDFNYTACHKL